MRRAIAVILVLLPLCASGQQTQKKLNVYGFADVMARVFILDESNPLWATSRGDAVQFDLSHLSVYGDWRPHPSLRFLAEVALTTYPGGAGGEPGTILDADVEINGLSTTLQVLDTLMEPVEPFDNSYDHPEDGPLDWGAIYFERFWMDLLFSQHLNLRVGKFITPSGIWNVDHGSPVILTVRQPLQTGLFRLFPRSQTGLMGYGTAFLGNTDLTYHAFASTGRGEIAIEDISEVGVGVNLEANTDIANGLTLGFSGYTGEKKEQQKWRRLELSVAVDPQVRLNPDFTVDSAASEAATDSVVTQALGAAAENLDDHAYGYTSTAHSREICLNASGKIGIGNVTLQSEFSYLELQNQLDSDAKSHVLGYYFLLSYRQPLGTRLTLTPYVMYERITTIDARNNPVDLAVAQQLDAFYDILAGINLKFFSAATLKLEYGFINIRAADDLDYGDMLNAHIIASQLSVAL